MHTIELRLEGEFYDSYVYSGRLYLWTLTNSLIVLDWDQLVESIKLPERDKVALGCAFRYSSLLYGRDIGFVLNDSELKDVVVRKFERLGRQPIELPRRHWGEFLIRELDNIFPFPHADLTVYFKEFFVGSKSGVKRAEIRQSKSQRPVPVRAETLWDGPSFSLAASRRTLAVAAGTEGAWQIDIQPERGWGLGRRENALPTQLIQMDAKSVRWCYGSIFASAGDGNGFLADYLEEEKPRITQKFMGRADTERVRELREVIGIAQIMDNRVDEKTYVWGVHDKICSADRTNVSVSSYKPYREDREDRFSTLGSIPFGRRLESDPIAADSSYFGFVLEFEDGLLIINSQTETLLLEGEPVNWRLFRNSINYENQLHVIRNDHLAVFSFNDDYLVNQEEKVIGIRHGQISESSRR